MPRSRPPIRLVLLAALAAACSPRPEPAASAPTVGVARLATACLDVGVKGCETDQGGYFNVDGHALYWQIQSGETLTDVSGAAHVFAVETPGGELKPVASGTDGWYYEAPRIVRMGEALYVAIAGGIKGSGSYNADAIYRWSPGATGPLVRVDTENWRATATRHLPAGLMINKGVLFNYGDETISATTSLWRDADPNCCPTGGEARLFFTIEGDQLVLKGAETLSRPAP